MDKHGLSKYFDKINTKNKHLVDKNTDFVYNFIGDFGIAIIKKICIILYTIYIIYTCEVCYG